MTPLEIARLLLRRMNRSTWSGVEAGVTMGGITSMLQRDINQAIDLWRSAGDTAGLRQVGATMHAYGKLTDTELEQIMEALDGES